MIYTNIECFEALHTQISTNTLLQTNNIYMSPSNGDKQIIVFRLKLFFLL